MGKIYKLNGNFYFLETLSTLRGNFYSRMSSNEIDINRFYRIKQLTNYKQKMPKK